MGSRAQAWWGCPWPAEIGQKRTVCYTTDAQIKNGNKFAAQGLQIVAGVPLHCDEPADFQTFRVGLFGLDKLGNIERTVARLEQR